MKNFYTTILVVLAFVLSATAQIEQVSDINPDKDSGIGSPYAFNGEIYFEADNGDGETGDELYRVNENGNVELFVNINQDPKDGSPNSDPKNFIEFNGKLYFVANDGDNTMHDIELWETDGTAENTKMVHDIWVGDGKASNPQNLFVFNNALYFQAKVESSTQWWKYDGTNAPVQVSQIRDNGLATVNYPIVDEENKIVYFSANDPKAQLFVMNANDEITKIELNASNHGYVGSRAILFNGKLYFQGDNGTDDDQLWVSDGTVEGTSMVKKINAADDGEPESFTIYNDKLYFVAQETDYEQLWVTDGTAEGTVKVAEPSMTDCKIEELKVYKNKLYFSATDSLKGQEMWVFDGDTTMLLKDINLSNDTDSDPKGFMEVGGFLFFTADDSTGKKLWVTDGTEENTKQVADFYTESENPLDVYYKEFVVIGSTLYFTGDDANGDDLFKIDATTLNLNIAGVNPNGSSAISKPFSFNGEIYFEANNGDGEIGDELYKLKADGTIVLVKNINQDPEDDKPNSDPKNYIVFKEKLYFTANDGDYTGHDTELWVTDGTEAGTQFVFDFYPGANRKDGNPQEMYVFNDKLYIHASDGSSSQWWAYDGTNDPVKITNLNGGAWASPKYARVDEDNKRVYFQATNPKNALHVMNASHEVTKIDIDAANHSFKGSTSFLFKEKLYFEADNGTDDDQLWVSNGTNEGTSMLKKINADGNADPESFTVFNDKLYFVARETNYEQLWVTDGTTEGTVKVAEPALGSCTIDNLIVYNNKLYFAATDSLKGKEMWVFDGTNTTLFKEFDSREGEDGNPKGFTVVDGLLFFEADDSTGNKLWVTNGTVDGTKKVAELLGVVSDPDKVNSAEFAVVETKLYYTADDGSGEEFFVVDAANLYRYNVAITVTDGTKLLAGAAVSFNNQTLITDSYGRASFANVRPGESMAFVVTKDGYNSADGVVTVINADVEADAVATMIIYTLTFNITGPGEKVEGATITICTQTGTTDAQGVAVIDSIAPGTDMAISVTHSGFAPYNGTLTVDKDATVDIQLEYITKVDDLNIAAFSIYPNPSSDVLNIQLNDMGTDASYRIFDAKQSQVMQGKVDGISIQHNLKPGFYLIQVTNEGNNYVQRLIVK